MRKIILSILVLFVLSACSAETKNPPNTENEKSIYYLAVWEECLTRTINIKPETKNYDVSEECKEELRIAIKEDFYSNRHSDMFPPFPKEMETLIK